MHCRSEGQASERRLAVFWILNQHRVQRLHTNLPAPIFFVINEVVMASLESKQLTFDQLCPVDVVDDFSQAWDSSTARKVGLKIEEEDLKRMIRITNCCVKHHPDSKSRKRKWVFKDSSFKSLWNGKSPLTWFQEGGVCSLSISEHDQT